MSVSLPVRHVKSSTFPPKLSHYSLITLISSVCSWVLSAHVTVYDTQTTYRWRWLIFVIAEWFLFHSVCSELIISYCSHSGGKNSISKLKSVLHHWTSQLNWEKKTMTWAWHLQVGNTQGWKTGTGNRRGREQEMDCVRNCLWCSSIMIYEIFWVHFKFSSINSIWGIMLFSAEDNFDSSLSFLRHKQKTW